MSSDYIRRRTGEVIEICRLEEYSSTHIGKLSKGFRQRVGIAQSILHEPDVLVLDEPTIGIDPIQVVETRQLIKDLGGEHTLILSTHILPEVSMICERVIIIHEGQIVAVDRPENLATRLRGVERIEIDARGPSREIADAIEAVEGVEAVDHRYSQEGGYSTFIVGTNPESEPRAELAVTVVNGGVGAASVAVCRNVA